MTERKVAALTNEQLMNLSRLDDVDEEDEDEDEAEEAPVAVAITVTTVPTAQHPAIVRTAKAEKRLKEKLQREVDWLEMLFIESVNKFKFISKGLELTEDEKMLSPNEQRALQVKVKTN